MSLRCRSHVLRYSAILLLGATGLPLAVHSPVAAKPFTHFERHIHWGACDSARGDLDPAVTCGTLRLPVDWSKSDAATYVARVYRQPAVGASRGTAIYFPSGPGENADIGFSSVKLIAPGYDVVGIDPRGVSSTSAVSCDASAVVSMPLATPVDPVAFGEGKAHRERVGRSCRTTPNALRKHLDAYSDARDAEAFRIALGSPRLLVYGASFGTLLSARYLELYGDQARGAILDGVLNPGEDRLSFQRTAAAESQRLFDEFSAWCARTEQCLVHRTGARRALAQAKGNADAAGIPGRSPLGRTWTSAGVVQAFELSASRGDFPATAATLSALSRGQNPEGGSVAQTPIAAGTYVPYPDDIICSNYDIGIRDLLTAVQVASAAYHQDIPYNTNSSAFTVGCSGSPAPKPIWRNPFRAKGDFPVLLLSNRLDIATPRRWAQKVAAQLGLRARLVTTSDIGHGTTDNLVAQQATIAYVKSLHDPARN